MNFTVAYYEEIQDFQASSPPCLLALQQSGRRNGDKTHLDEQPLLQPRRVGGS